MITFYFFFIFIFLYIFIQLSIHHPTSLSLNPIVQKRKFLCKLRVKAKITPMSWMHIQYSNVLYLTSNLQFKEQVELVAHASWSLLGSLSLTCIDPDKEILFKILVIFLPINSNMCFGCSKESSHWDQCALLSRGLNLVAFGVTWRKSVKTWATSNRAHAKKNSLIA